MRFSSITVSSCQTKAIDASKNKLIVQLRRLFMNEEVILIFIASYRQQNFQVNFFEKILLLEFSPIQQLRAIILILKALHVISCALLNTEDCNHFKNI
jgi:hypothetical protein